MRGLRVERLDHLGIVAGVCQETGLAAYLDELATPSAQMPFARWVPGGETWLEFSVRAAAALHRIVREHTGQTTVIVCHGGIIEVSFSLFFDLSGAPLQRLNVDTGHTSITHWQKVTPPPGFLSDWLLERYNDRSHLLEEEQTI